MAVNPQPTDPHLIVAHSIWEAIMQRDFSKRQVKILDLILRLSWGCGKKYAIIPKQKDFQVVGVGEGHIKAELNWMVTSKIITIDGDQYSFNKMFEEWQVSRVLPFIPEKLTELVSINIADAKANRDKLTELVSNEEEVTELVSSHNEKTYRISKFATSDLASRKESSLNIYNSNEENINSHLPQKLTETVSAADIWVKVLGELAKQVSGPNYRTWLDKKTVGIDIQENLFIIGVPNSFIEEYLEKNQINLIARTLATVAGRDMAPVFRVMPMPEGG